ncbi:hypothetical protein B0H13DRAFT_2320095 [Mycena leptocephala]|nr:hypothetical protein B0H13DRAFT_2320095 [Mycena leptocephala]
MHNPLCRGVLARTPLAFLSFSVVEPVNAYSDEAAEDIRADEGATYFGVETAVSNAMRALAPTRFCLVADNKWMGM